MGCRDRKRDAQAGVEGAVAHSTPEISLELTPELGQGALLVTVRLTGPPAARVGELRAARTWADTRGAEVVRDIEVRDAQGVIEVGPARDEGADRVFPLARRPLGSEVIVRYRASGSGGLSSRLALRVGGGRVSGVGHSFLLLPPITTPTPARIQWSLGALGRGAEGASSFGPGNDVRAVATSEQLAHAVYVAGRLAMAQESDGDRMILAGEAELDVGAVLEWTRRVEGHARRFFRESAPSDPSVQPGREPFSFVLIAEPGMGRSHDGAHLTRSLGLWFDATRALDAPLRIAIAHELLHRWIGSAVSLNEEDGRDARWFSEGFTVHYARAILFREGLINAADFAEDLRRTLDPGSSGERARGSGKRHEGYQRGALYAVYLDASIRKRSRGARSLDDLVVDLIHAARSAGKNRLPTSAFREFIVRELGREAGDDFDRLITRAERPIALQESAFGPCFRRERAKETVFELGFDPASLRDDPALIRGLVKGSAAERAGLREGALVLASKVPDPEGQASAREVELTVAGSGSGGGQRIRYKPAAKRDVVRWTAKPCKR